MPDDRGNFNKIYVKSLSSDEIVKEFFYQSQSEKGELLTCKKCFQKITLKKNVRKHVMTHVDYYNSMYSTFFEDDPATGKVRCKKVPHHLVQYNYAARHYEHCHKGNFSSKLNDNLKKSGSLAASPRAADEPSTNIAADLGDDEFETIKKQRKVESTSKLLANRLTDQIVSFSKELSSIGEITFRKKIHDLLESELEILEAQTKKRLNQSDKNVKKALLKTKGSKTCHKEDSQKSLKEDEELLKFWEIKKSRDLEQKFGNQLDARVYALEKAMLSVQQKLGMCKVNGLPNTDGYSLSDFICTDSTKPCGMNSGRDSVDSIK